MTISDCTLLINAHSFPGGGRLYIHTLIGKLVHERAPVAPRSSGATVMMLGVSDLHAFLNAKYFYQGRTLPSLSQETPRLEFFHHACVLTASYYTISA